MPTTDELQTQINALTTAMTAKAEHAELDTAEGILTTKADETPFSALQVQVTAMQTLLNNIRALGDSTFSGNLSTEIDTLFTTYQSPIDNGDGTFTISTRYTDNGDGTFTFGP